MLSSVDSSFMFNPDRRDAELDQTSNNWAACMKSVPRLLSELRKSGCKDEVGAPFWRYVCKINQLLQGLHQCSENALMQLPPNLSDDLCLAPNTTGSLETLFGPPPTLFPLGLLTPDATDSGEGESDSENLPPSAPLPTPDSTLEKDLIDLEWDESPRQNLPTVDPSESAPPASLATPTPSSPPAQNGSVTNETPEQKSSILDQWKKEIVEEESQSGPGEAIFKAAALKWETAPAGLVQKRCFLEVMERPDEAVLCQIAYVDSQARFFVTPLSEGKIYTEMENRLQDVADIMKLEGFGFIQYPVGYPCVARYSVDQRWYRAEVMSVGRDDCLLQFMDYGNTGCVPFHHILPLPLNFAELPAGAIHCRLLGVDTRELSSTLVRTFKSEICEGESVIVVPKEPRQGKGTDAIVWEVELQHRKTFRDITERYHTPKGRFPPFAPL